MGLVLALCSAAAINLGFLLQHRGLRSGVSGAWGKGQLVRAALHSPTWLVGQGLGWLGFAVQVAALSIAPLSLVQAFAAGGLALSVPLAAATLGYRVSSRQTVAVLLTAASLASLPVALASGHDHLTTSALIACAAAGTGGALALGRLRSPALQAIAAGVFYGVADSAIRAVSVKWGVQGAGALVSI